MAGVPLAGTDWIPGRTAKSRPLAGTKERISWRSRGTQMASWNSIAKQHGIKYFLVAFLDLFGTMRAKIVPTSAMEAVAKEGAGFAGFAAWFDMTPADPDVLAIPEIDTSRRCRGNLRWPG